MIWRPTAESKIDKLERIQCRAVKWILNEQDHHYNDWEYICRLRDLDLLPLKYVFQSNDLIIFHKIYYNAYFVKLPQHFRSCESIDRTKLRSNIAPPNYYNSQKENIDLSTMRAISLDNKSLKCTLSKTSHVLRKAFFYRAHILWNFLPLEIREVTCSSKFCTLLKQHLWDIVLKPD